MRRCPGDRIQAASYTHSHRMHDIDPDMLLLRIARLIASGTLHDPVFAVSGRVSFGSLSGNDTP